MTLVTAWLLDRAHPLRPPKAVQVTIRRTEKMDYAVLPNGRRFVIGITAFLAEKPAHQRWQGELDKMRKNTYLQLMRPETAYTAELLCKVSVYTPKSRKSRKPESSK